jgi:hypothetical protein
MSLVEAALAHDHDLPTGDYLSPGLDLVRPDSAFPHLTIGNTDVNPWPYLRREIAQNWYVDDRNPTVGFCSRDEAAILYNTARLFAGQPCIEIGCWRGWSTCHLALGSGGIHVIDPVLRDEEFLEDVRGSLSRAGVLDAVVLHDGFSPGAVGILSTDLGVQWSLAFIDGDHEGDAPHDDAVAVARHAAPDAQILFHDLASPDVARGLAVLRDLGWHTMIFQTMQIMGVAWRGAIPPIHHTPDPDQAWTLPEHLASFPVCGENIEDRAERFLAVLDSSAQEYAATLREHAELSSSRDELSRRFDELHAAYLRTARRLSESATTLAVVQAQLRDLAPRQGIISPEIVRTWRRRLRQARPETASRIAIRALRKTASGLWTRP